MVSTLIRKATPALHKLDHAVGRLQKTRTVLVELRTPVYQAVLGPIAESLAAEPVVELWYTSENRDRIEPLVPPGRFLSHAEVEWRRFDLYLNGDPWAAARLRRCAHRVNFFHGVAGKYDLDNPAGLPMGFEYYDRVAFINRDRMTRYLAAGVVTPEQAVLVGYPKLDALATGAWDAAAVRAELGLGPSRPVALYAPTYSEASSLHLAGEQLVQALIGAGFNVIAKLHDRSLDPDSRYNAGTDWRQRFRTLERPGRMRYVEGPDCSPWMAAADLMVTDHSSVGFEFLVLDRPLIVFDAPDLPRVARINPDKVELLRRAATVVHTVDELARAAVAERANPQRLSTVRRKIADEMFHAPGGATARAVELLLPFLRPQRASNSDAEGAPFGGGA